MPSNISPPKTSPALLLAMFALALLLSAGLLFNIQPMIGKMLLPRVGGSPYVWNVVMAFFQLALLAGYLIAHLLTKLKPLQHGIIYLAALAASAIFLPIGLPANWQPDTAGYLPLALLQILLITIAMPFVALSLSAPTLQRLFTSSSHARAQDPYFLYVASNLGSFTGLLIYPFVLEPLLNVHQQAEAWSYGMYLLMALVALCLFIQSRQPATEIAEVKQADDDTTLVTPQQRGMWILLSFIPSSLTLGVTTFITSDITATPLLWVATLALYLLTFMIAFAQRGAYIRRLSYKFYPWFAAASIASVKFIIVFSSVMVVIALIAFFTTALVCHTELARRRPAAKHLTDFYLCLSIGGALGGSFNAFIAPVIFNYMLEYPLILIAALALNMRDPLRRNEIVYLTGPIIWIGVVGSLFLINYLLVHFSANPQAVDSLYNILLVPLLAFIFVPLHFYRRLAWGACSVMLITLLAVPFIDDKVYMGRDFFGIMVVSDYHAPEGTWGYRILQHGTTTHGIEITTPERLAEPTSYYGNGAPMNNIWMSIRPKNIAVMGLGSGTLNCLTQPGQKVHFFEIDPLVVEVAHKYFHFLDACPTPRITIGDGRLEMAKDTETYDLIIIDAFSSDSVPIHLLTKEAIAIYMSKLNPGGVLGFHISNRFFDLEPVLAAAAKDLGLYARYGRTPDNLKKFNSSGIVFESEMVAIAKTQEALDALTAQPATWRHAQNPRNIRAWSDDYSNILAAMK